VLPNTVLETSSLNSLRLKHCLIELTYVSLQCYHIFFVLFVLCFICICVCNKGICKWPSGPVRPVRNIFIIKLWAARMLIN